MLLSCDPHKKVTKESVIGKVLNCALPRTKATLPYVPIQARTWLLPSTLTVQAVTSQHFRRCARERYIGEGVFGARQRDISASPMPDSFRPFLAGTRKGHFRSCKKIYYNFRMKCKLFIACLQATKTGKINCCLQLY